MIENFDLESILNEKYNINKSKNNYKIIYKKFNKDFPKEKTEKLLKKIDNPFINRFIEIMKKNNKEKYLNNFISNLSSIKIIDNEHKQKKILSSTVYGELFYKNHKFYLILGSKDDLEKNNALLTPYHELLHLLSTKVVNKKTVKMGLQFNDFGIGLNEGYTELLTKRYFKDEGNDDCNSYKHFTWFIEMIEEIIGREKTEEFFFDSNVEGLIVELSKYLSTNQIINLIEDIDLLFDNESDIVEYIKDEKIDAEIIRDFYSVNKELRNRIFNKIIKIYSNKEMQTGIKTNFIENNSIINYKYEREEELVCDYFDEEYGNKIGGK